MSMPTECLSPETMTDLIEGRGSSRKRKLWYLHLDACFDCRSILADAAEYEQQHRERQPELSEGWLRRLVDAVAVRPTLAYGGASVLALVLALTGVWIVIRDATAPGALTVRSISAPLLDLDRDVTAGFSWKQERSGAAFMSALSREAVAFRLGVHLVDVYLADRHEARADALAAVGEVEQLVPFFDDPHVVATSLNDLRRTVEAGGDAAAKAEALERVASTQSDAAMIRFGGWSESGRLAAVARSSEYFESQDFADRLQGIHDLEIDPSSLNVISRIEELTEPGTNLDPTQLARLEREFRRLLLMH